MIFKNFSVLLSCRLALIFVALLALSYLFSSPAYRASSLLLTLLLIVQVGELLRFISRTNAELVRFFDAARYADYSQRFKLDTLGSGFKDLGKVFEEILQGFEKVRAQQEQERHQLKALVEHVPVPLLSIHQNGQISLWNNSVRRLFGTHSVNRLQDLQQFGEGFADKLCQLKAGEQALVKFSIDGMEQQLSIAATQILLSGRQDMLLSMQNIQTELDLAQLQAWQDLVRVLTHEIMNSITPVASLAKTAVDLMEDTSNKHRENAALQADLNDINEALHTVARRSEGLTQFVGSYRRLTRLPPPNKKRIKISALFLAVTRLASQDWQEKGIALQTRVDPGELEFEADLDMLEQLLINLLKNAEQALENTQHALVKLSAELNPRGHTQISVSDNGPGITEDIAEKIFVPFFTTKREGSGVGLALTRQVMILHGGSVKLVKSPSGGAQFNLLF